MKNKTPRWFGIFTLMCGLYALVYLSLTADSMANWIDPNGIYALILIAAGLRWTFHQSRPKA